MTPALRPAVLADLAACRGLVQACGLPLGGLEHAFPGGYIVGVDAVLAGCAGVELYDEAGLLRSVAVAPEARGRGLGELLTRSRIAYARERRIESLWLLTTTAPAFFLRLGFAIVDRRAAPPVLAAAFSPGAASSSTHGWSVLGDRLSKRVASVVGPTLDARPEPHADLTTSGPDPPTRASRERDDPEPDS